MLVRISVFIGGVLLLMMAMGGVIVRREPPLMYWVLSQEDSTPPRWYFMLFDNQTSQPLLRVESRIVESQYHYWWSPDGKWLFYQGLNGHSHDLMRLHPIHGHPQTVISHVRWFQEGYRPTFHSPNSRWIAINDVTSYKLMIANGDGTEVRTLITNTGYEIIDYFWSPDSRWLYYVVLDNDRHFTYRVNVEGTANQLIYPDAISPVWSPDGEWIVFREQGKKGDIVKVRADGSEIEHLISGDKQYYIQAWLENDWLLLWHTTDVYSASNLYKMRPTKDDLPHLLYERVTALLSWSSDGEKLFLGKTGTSSECVLITVFTTTGENTCQERAEASYYIEWNKINPNWALFAVTPNVHASTHPSQHIMVAKRDGSGLHSIFEVIEPFPHFPPRLMSMPDKEWIIYSERLGDSINYNSFQRRIRVLDGYVQQLPVGYPETVSPPIKFDLFMPLSVLPILSLLWFIFGLTFLIQRDM